MRNISLLALLSVFAIYSSGEAQPQPQAFTVHATGQWQDSKWNVNAGDNIMVMARGIWAFADSTYWGDWVTPDGVAGQTSGSGMIVSNANQFSLVMKVGLSGTPWGVGSNWVGPVPTSGNLLFSMNDASIGFGDNAGSIVVSVVKNFVIPTKVSVGETHFNEGPDFRLRQNYPNPFNPTTTIQYELSKRGNVQLKIYNETGQLVRTMIEEQHNAGGYSAIWDGRNDRGEAVATGTYYYQIAVDNSLDVKKMILLR